VANELTRIGMGVSVDEAADCFFADIFDDFRRLMAVTVIGVVLMRDVFRCRVGVVDVDGRVNRRSRRRSECF